MFWCGHTEHCLTFTEILIKLWEISVVCFCCCYTTTPLENLLIQYTYLVPPGVLYINCHKQTNKQTDKQTNDYAASWTFSAIFISMLVSWSVTTSSGQSHFCCFLSGCREGALVVDIGLCLPLLGVHYFLWLATFLNIRHAQLPPTHHLFRKEVFSNWAGRACQG